MVGEIDMSNSPQRTAVSPALQARSYDKENLFRSYEERQAFERFKTVLAVSMGTYVSGGINQTAQDARIRGIARACAHAISHRALHAKPSEAGLSSIADVRVAFQDELERLYDLYKKNSGGGNGQ